MASSAPSRFFWPITSPRFCPSDVLGAEIGRALGFAEITDLSQVVMPKLSSRINFTSEPGNEGRVPGPQELHDLQVNVAVEPQLPRQVHRPQGGPAQLAQNKIPAEQTGNRSGAQTTPREGTSRNSGSRAFIAVAPRRLSGPRKSRRRSDMFGERHQRATRGFRFDLARAIRWRAGGRLFPLGRARDLLTLGGHRRGDRLLPRVFRHGQIELSLTVRRTPSCTCPAVPS